MRTIQGVIYYPATSKQGGFFYPIINFYGPKIGSQSFWLNEPLTSRSKARTIAKNYIKNI